MRARARRQVHRSTPAEGRQHVHTPSASARSPPRAMRRRRFARRGAEDVAARAQDAAGTPRRSPPARHRSRARAPLPAPRGRPRAPSPARVGATDRACRACRKVPPPPRRHRCRNVRESVASRHRSHPRPRDPRAPRLRRAVARVRRSATLLRGRWQAAPVARGPRRTRRSSAPRGAPDAPSSATRVVRPARGRPARASASVAHAAFPPRRNCARWRAHPGSGRAFRRQPSA